MNKKPNKNVSGARQDSGPGPEEQAMKIIVLSDGRIGHENQSLGVAAALGVPDPEVIRLVPKYAARWLQWLPVTVLYGDRLAQVPDADVIIGTGWRVSRVARWLRAARGVFAVQMMRPSGRPSDYDVVALPRHSLRGAWANGASNVVVTVGAPNRVTPLLLKHEAERWGGRLRHCPAPRLAVMVGGHSKHGRFGKDEARMLLESVLAWANTNGGSLLVTTSRRTDPAVATMIVRLLQDQQRVPFNVWQPDDVTQRDNPYLAYLGLCDAVVVTAESVAMVSEAATAGKPVYLFGDEAAMPPKFRLFYGLLKQQQRLGNWLGQLTLRVPREGLADAGLVAGFVRAKWDARRGMAA